MIIGSFYIEEKSLGVAKVYTVSYKSTHKKNLYWQFIDDGDLAKKFAQQKTTEDNKFYAKNE